MHLVETSQPQVLSWEAGGSWLPATSKCMAQHHVAGAKPAPALPMNTADSTVVTVCTGHVQFALQCMPPCTVRTTNVMDSCGKAACQNAIQSVPPGSVAAAASSRIRRLHACAALRSILTSPPMPPYAALSRQAPTVARWCGCSSGATSPRNVTAPSPSVRTACFTMILAVVHNVQSCAHLGILIFTSA
jgi:hypothetical protein